MKKHKYKNIMHCPECWDKGTKRLWDIKPQPDMLLVSPHRYKNLKKYGMVEGWFKNDAE